MYSMQCSLCSFRLGRSRFPKLDFGEEMTGERKRQLKLSLKAESIKPIIKPQQPLPEKTR